MKKSEKIILLIFLMSLIAIMLCGNQWGLLTQKKLELLNVSNERLTEIAEESSEEFQRKIGSEDSTYKVFGSDEETANRRMRRFLLYTHEPDEYYVLLALSRMKPGQFNFNTYSMEYGNTFLIPLGIVIKTCDWIGTTKILTLKEYLLNPLEFHSLYRIGRGLMLINLFFFILLYYYFGKKMSAADAFAWHLSAAFVLSSSIIVEYYHIIKPHAFVLPLILLSLYFLYRYHTSETIYDFYLSSLFAGAAVAGILNASIFVLLLLITFKRKHIRKLLIAILFLSAGFLIFNNHYLLEFRTAIFYPMRIYDYYFSAKPAVGNSDYLNATRIIIFATGLPGFILISALTIRAILIGSGFEKRIAAVIIIHHLFFSSALRLVSNNYLWARYYCYIFVLAGFLMWMYLKKTEWRKLAVLTLCLVIAFQIVRASEISLNLVGDSSDATSTRANAGMWINSRIPEGSRIYVSAPSGRWAPFNTPYFAFERFVACKEPETAEYLVMVNYDHGSELDIKNIPGSFRLIKKFSNTSVLTDRYHYYQSEIDIYEKI